MKRPIEDYAEIAPPARKWGIPLVRFWGVQRPALEALTAAPTPAPQVNFTVVHVAAGALVSFGGIDPRLTPAVPQPRAVTATPTEGEQE